MPEITISDDDFLRFKEYFYRKTGIMFDDSKRYFVDKRLVERIQTAGYDSFKNYFIYMRFEASQNELQHLTNIMTVNETYFFREEYQFRCMVNSILPEIIKNKTRDRLIRIWSIPSSSGEEPYSIALYLLEYWDGINDWDVEIISSDIDTHIVEQAKRGRYSARSIQHIPIHILQKYFTPSSNGEYLLSNDIKSAVEFTKVNLVNNIDTKAYRNFDIIFCRNLLIYFDDVSRKIAAETFYDALNDSGFICLGHSESMSRITSIFKIRKFPDAIVYQKPKERP